MDEPFPGVPLAAADAAASVLAEVARALHRLRLRLGLSQEELAARAAVPAAEIAAYESEPAALTAQTALQVIDALAALAPAPGDGPGDQPAAEPPAPKAGASPLAPLLADMEARMEEIGAALAIDKRDFGEALRRLDRGLALRPSAARAGELRFVKSAVMAELGHEEQALALLAEAQRSVSLDADPKLWLRMRLDELHLLCQLGRFADAEALEGQAVAVAAAVGNDRRWVEMRCLAGRIAAGSGRPAEAAPLLQEASAELAAAGRTREAVALALDLAALSIEQGDAAGLAAVAAVARQLAALARRKKVGSAVRLRIKVFCWSVRGKRLDAERTRTLARELRRLGRLRRPYELPARALPF